MMQMHENHKYRFSNLSQSGQDANNSIIFSDDSALMMMVSDEGVYQNQRCASREQSRGRSQVQSAQHPPVFKKNQSSPSKIFRQYQPQKASRSPYRNYKEGSDAGTATSKRKSTVGRQMSPTKQSLSKFCNEKTGPGVSKATEYIGVQDNSIQNVHQRLRDYQGSHGKTSVSKALFQQSNKSD